MDPPLCNTRFTWSNLQENLVCCRLDRFLYSLGWDGVFPNSRQESLPRVVSDHCPIVLESCPLKWGPTPFRFENMWLEHACFKRNFEEWWSNASCHGWEGFKFMRKLKMVKEKVKCRNREVWDFGIFKKGGDEHNC